MPHVDCMKLERCFSRLFIGHMLVWCWKDATFVNRDGSPMLGATGTIYYV